MGVLHRRGVLWVNVAEHYRSVRWPDIQQQLDQSINYSFWTITKSFQIIFLFNFSVFSFDYCNFKKKKKSKNYFFFCCNSFEDTSLSHWQYSSCCLLPKFHFQLIGYTQSKTTLNSPGCIITQSSIKGLKLETITATEFIQLHTVKSVQEFHTNHHITTHFSNHWEKLLFIEWLVSILPETHVMREN